MEQLGVDSVGRVERVGAEGEGRVVAELEDEPGSFGGEGFEVGAGLDGSYDAVDEIVEMVIGRLGLRGRIGR